MLRTHMTTTSLIMLLVLVGAARLPAADWPIWGKDASRNMVSAESGLPDSFEPGRLKEGSEEIDLATTKNVKWVAKMGSQCYGNPTVSGGKVFVGTNNESPRNPDHVGDRGIIMCLDEQTGELIWQLIVPKLGAGKVSDWEYLGICSSPGVDRDRVFVVTNRCEVVCVDTEGMLNGNDGPFMYEKLYMDGTHDGLKEQGALPPPDDPSLAIGADSQVADIIWRFDMRDELGVFPHNIASNSVMVVGDTVYVATSNGVDWSHTNIPSPKAPAFIALDRNTGELVGEEGVGISQRLFHCNWASPAWGEIEGKGQVIFGAGDGFCYGFDPEPVEDEDGFLVFNELWRYDCNPPLYRRRDDGKPQKYATYKGPSEIIATPVFHNGRVYVAIGQDPEHGEGVGNLVCIDASKSGDITQSGRVWEYDKINRTISTVSIADGLVFAADYAGTVHCLDAETGEFYWSHDTESHMWGSTLVGDGKVYLGAEDGRLVVLAATKEKKLINETEMGVPVYSSPIAANGVVYIGTQTHLYAISDEETTVAAGD